MAVFEKWKMTDKQEARYKRKTHSGGYDKGPGRAPAKCQACHVHPVAKSGLCTACVSLEKAAEQAKAKRLAKMKRRA